MECKNTATIFIIVTGHVNFSNELYFKNSFKLQAKCFEERKKKLFGVNAIVINLLKISTFLENIKNSNEISEADFKSFSFTF